MPSPAIEGLIIRYEGGGEADELLGATQANFMVIRPDVPGNEVAVFLNHPATAFLAAEFGQADSEEFRQGAARVVGRIYIERRIAKTGQVEAIQFVSKANFHEDPGLLDAVKRAVRA